MLDPDQSRIGVVPSPVGPTQACLVGWRVGRDLQNEDALEPNLAHCLRGRNRDAQDGPHHLHTRHLRSRSYRCP